MVSALSGSASPTARTRPAGPSALDGALELPLLELHADRHRALASRPAQESAGAAPDLDHAPARERDRGSQDLGVATNAQIGHSIIGLEGMTMAS